MKNVLLRTNTAKFRSPISVIKCHIRCCHTVVLYNRHHSGQRVFAFFSGWLVHLPNWLEKYGNCLSFLTNFLLFWWQLYSQISIFHEVVGIFYADVVKKLKHPKNTVFFVCSQFMKKKTKKYPVEASEEESLRFFHLFHSFRWALLPLRCDVFNRNRL